jgi:hypothetical protein
MDQQSASQDRRFPIGRFRFPDTISTAEREGMVDRLASTPARLREAASSLSEAQLDTPYREGGWTARQVIHHVPDSHMNSYVRFKLALTENEPTIKPYDEGAWALLGDTVATPIETSMALLESLHARWVILLRGLSETQWKATMRHPVNGLVRLDQALALYAWHGDHHIAHIKLVKA